MRDKRRISVCTSVTALLFLVALWVSPLAHAQKASNPSSDTLESGAAAASESGSTTAQAQSQPVPGATASSSSQPQVVEVTGYSLRDSGDTANVTQIRTNDIVRIKVTVLDTRPVPDGAAPNVIVNSSSFTTQQSNMPAGDASVRQIGGGNYELTFLCKYTGTGKAFAFDLSYGNATGIALTALSLTLNQCVEYVAPEKEDEPPAAEEVVIRGTGFSLKSVSLGDEEIIAGKEYTLNAVIMATNGDYAIDNVSVSLMLPKELAAKNSKSVYYVGRLLPGAEHTVSFVIVPSATVDPGSYTVTLNISGASAYDGAAVLTAAEAVLTVNQQDRFELFNVSTPAVVNVGDTTGYSSITVVNKGKSSVYNVAVSLESSVLSFAEGNVFIGTVEPGKQGNANFILKAQDTGDFDGIIVIEYENALGELSYIRHKFSVEVTAKTVGLNTSASDLDTEDENAGLPSWVWPIITLLIAFVAVQIVFYRNRKKKLDEDEENEEASDADEAI